jgi:hypothetical protein
VRRLHELNRGPAGQPNAVRWRSGCRRSNLLQPFDNPLAGHGIFFVINAEGQWPSSHTWAVRQETPAGIFKPNLQIRGGVHAYEQQLRDLRWQPFRRIDEEERRQATDKQ